MLKNKFFPLLLLSSSLISLCSCDTTENLLILNWGEYINQDVVDEFEEKYNCNVTISIADSNELFYSKVKSGTTRYDLVVPQDYMVQKMVDKQMIQKIDFTKIENYNRDIFVNDVNHILDQMDSLDESKEYSSYCVPYFWGTFGIMYSKRKTELEDIINTNQWNAFFENNILNSDQYKIGMYNVPRFVYAATMFYNNMSPNEITDESLNACKNTLENRKFYSWGTDSLKKGVQAGNIDLAYVYTGDFLDMAYETLKINPNLDEMLFDICIPQKTISFLDTMVMPNNARHKDLAYKFLNFLLDSDVAYLNAQSVGYCTTIKSTYDKIISNVNNSDEWFNAWGNLNKKYYPITEDGNYKGTQLSYFDDIKLKQVSNLINNSKIK